MKTSTISIVVLAGNEENMIEDCLKSCSWANELILVAANSNDNTVSLAKKIIPNIKVVKTFDEYNKNFSKWRNLGFKEVTSDWIFYVDADERVTEKLRTEILKNINLNNSHITHYAIPRANYFLGKRVKHGGTYPDYVKRIYLKNKFEGYQGYLHEEPIIEGDLVHLKSDLLHYTHRNLKSMIEKTLAWTEMESEALYKSNHPPVVWWRILRMMLTKIWERLIKQQMWKDGTVGFISVIFESFDTFIIYSKLWELQQSNK